MAFLYNSITKKFLFAPRETPPYVPGLPDEPSFGLIRDGDLGARDCCCCPCCAVPEGSQIYVCTNDTKKRRCINDGGTPKCNHATCQPDTCCNGACCQGTSCSIKADVVCQQLGGVFKGCGTTCAAGVCECPAGQVLCGNVCCPEGQVCVDGECVLPCSGPCDTSCYVAYCCSPDGQCGFNGDGCADALGCQERWNAPAFFATGAEAQEFADNFNADNPLWQFGCGMVVSTSQALGLECPPEKQSNPCPEGCECVDGQCVPNLLP